MSLVSQHQMQDLVSSQKDLMTCLLDIVHVASGFGKLPICLVAFSENWNLHGFPLLAAQRPTEALKSAGHWALRQSPWIALLKA